MLERQEVLERLAGACADLWTIARHEAPEQVEAIAAVEAGKAVPRVILQLGRVLQVSVDVLLSYGDGGAVRMLYIEVPPIGASN